MPEWLQRFIPESWGNQEILIAAVSFTVVTSVISLAMVACVVVRLPNDYFLSDRAASRWNDSNLMIRWPVLIIQHIFGLLLIILGIIMSLPAVPGQGILTIMVGIMMLEFPGKRKLERWVVRRRGVTAGLNKIRARFGRDPLQLDNPAAVP